MLYCSLGQARRCSIGLKTYTASQQQSYRRTAGYTYRHATFIIGPDQRTYLADSGAALSLINRFPLPFGLRTVVRVVINIQWLEILCV